MMGWMEKWPSQPGRGARRNPCTAAAAASRVLLAATALLAILSSSRLTSVDAANTDPRVRLDGRFVPGPDDGATGGLPQLMTWPSSAATLAFSGAASVTVVLDGRLEALPSPDREYSELFRVGVFPTCAFQFEVDGVLVGSNQTTPGQPVLTWTHEGLSAGEHTLTVHKVSEPRAGAAWLQTVGLPPGGRFLPPPPSRGARTGRRLLFLGDSYTVGAGNVGPPGCRSPHRLTSATDSLQSYGPLVARHYQANFQHLAWSGAGLAVWPKERLPELQPAQARKASPRMFELLSRSDALDPDSRHNDSSWQPQVVVMAGGTNDFHEWTLSDDKKVQPFRNAPPTLQLWLAEFEALVRDIRATHPAAALVVMTWPLEVQLQLYTRPLHAKTLPQTAFYLQYMAAAATRLQQAALPNTFFLQLDGAAMNGSAFCLAHPDAAAHAAAARQLVRFIDGAVPAFAA